MPSTDTPADDASRGLTARNFTERCRWSQGVTVHVHICSDTPEQGSIQSDNSESCMYMIETATNTSQQDSLQSCIMYAHD